MKAITKYLIITCLRQIILLYIRPFGNDNFYFIVYWLYFLSGTKTNFISFLAGLTRTISILSIIIFICNYISRVMENKEIDLIISKNFSRDKIILSYIVAFSFNFLIFSLIPFLLIMLLGNNPLGSLIWFISFLFEGLIIITFAILISIINKNAIPTTLISITFYFLSRTMGFLLATEMTQ